MNKLTALASGVLISLSIAVSSQAAGIYETVIQVNDKVVTKFEIDQRVRMLTAFSTPGDVRQQAMDQLIDDRLRNQAAKQSGITISDEAVLGGMEEFAARGSFSMEQLLEFFRQQGVYRETFEDFVRSGLLWRNVVGSRFSSKVNITDDEVDANLDIRSINFPKTVNVAEIIIPIKERGATKTLALAKRISENVKNLSQFGAAARKYSKSATATRNGAMGWIPLGNLPAQVSSRLSGMTAGQTTAPINIGSAIAIYQLIGVREAKSASQQVIAVSYLQVALPSNSSGRDGQIATALKLINAGDTCLDMEANASDFGESAVSSHSVPASDVPVRIGAEIARLDPNEATYFVAENGGINVVMLCNRAKDLPDGARDQIRNALFNQRVTSFGDGYLQELRGDAIITRK